MYMYTVSQKVRHFSIALLGIDRFSIFFHFEIQRERVWESYDKKYGISFLTHSVDMFVGGESVKLSYIIIITIIIITRYFGRIPITLKNIGAYNSFMDNKDIC